MGNIRSCLEPGTPYLFGSYVHVVGGLISMNQLNIETNKFNSVYPICLNLFHTKKFDSVFCVVNVFAYHWKVVVINYHDLECEESLCNNNNTVTQLTCISCWPLVSTSCLLQNTWVTVEIVVLLSSHPVDLLPSCYGAVSDKYIISLSLYVWLVTGGPRVRVLGFSIGVLRDACISGRVLNVCWGS